MELRSYLEILWRRKWVVVGVTVAAIAIAAIVTLLTPPTYRSTSTVRVETVGGSLIDVARTDINYTVRLMNTYGEIVTSRTVRSEIREQLGLEALPTISVNLIPNTELMSIVAEASDPNTAQQVAETATNIVIAQSRELSGASVEESAVEILAQQVAQVEAELVDARAEYERLLAESPEDQIAITAAGALIDLKERTQGTLLRQYEDARIGSERADSVSIVEPPLTPVVPSTPRTNVNLALGLVVGLFAGIGIAFLVDNLDTRLHTTQQIEAITQAPAIGQIPQAAKQLRIVNVDSANGHRPQLEAFRRLRTNLISSHVDKPSQLLMVTSAKRGEGKSTVLANLAVTMAQSGRKVVVVDCDLRLPTMHELFELPNKRGLTNILTENKSVTDVVQNTSFSRVKAITSGPLPPNPTELLSSSKMDALMEQLRGEFDVVLFDTPALLSVSDAAVLVPKMDDVILVVARANSSRDAVKTVRQQLANVNANSVGVVINRVERNSGSYTNTY